MKGRFGIITVLLVLVIVFCIRGTVFSKENDKRARENQYYAVMQDEYVKQAKQRMEEQGYSNCGVTVTWVVQSDGSREYTVLLHHRKLEKLSPEEKGEVIRSLSDMEFGRGTCRFRYDTVVDFEAL